MEECKANRYAALQGGERGSKFCQKMRNVPYQKGKWERQIPRDCKLNIYFKNNFNLLVMNVTQLNFLIDKMCIYDTLLKLIIREFCCL